MINANLNLVVEKDNDNMTSMYLNVSDESKVDDEFVKGVGFKFLANLKEKVKESDTTKPNLNSSVEDKLNPSYIFQEAQSVISDDDRIKMELKDDENGDNTKIYHASNNGSDKEMKSFVKSDTIIMDEVGVTHEKGMDIGNQNGNGDVNIGTHKSSYANIVNRGGNRNCIPIKVFHYVDDLDDKLVDLPIENIRNASLPFINTL